MALENKNVKISDDKIDTYHSVAEKEFGQVRFTGIAEAERKKPQNINEFYVENTFSYYGKEIEKLYEYDSNDIVPYIHLKNIFDLGNKIILIGGAGFGKTTTLNYLFCNYENLFNASALKLKLDLKEYATEIGEKKRSILWCISNEFSKKIAYTGYNFDDLQSFISNKLQIGMCLIILDALDEIPTQALRNTVRSEIENFTSLYYLNRFIISTREAGYLRNRFDDTFLHIRINAFNKDQIEQYSKNWYMTYYDSSQNNNSFESFWENFYNEVNRARCENLIKNPIILILALVIFDIGKNLPTRRIEFYQKCIDTFLTEREERKAAVPLSDKVKSILAMNLTVPKIAFYKYSKIKCDTSYKFNYSELENSIMQAIDVDDEINWGVAVKDYSAYLIERTELIKEVDEGILDFAHKTFYEYFLSFYFSKMYSNDEIKELLWDWIGDPNYDELSRLIIETIIQNNDPRQHDFIISYLFDILMPKNNDLSNTSFKMDVFSVIADLYSHNLLQPKYQLKYNSFVLYNSTFIGRLNVLNRRRENSLSTVLYDSQIVSKMFMEDYNNGKLINIIDAIKYLNNDFRKQISNADATKLLYHISRLFSASSINQRYSELPNEELIYFLNEGIEHTLKYPQIFTSVVALSLHTDIVALLNPLINYTFEPRNVLYNYMNNTILSKLISTAASSTPYFALLLICLIDCTAEETNAIIRHLLIPYRRYYSESNISDTHSFLAALSKSLNEYSTYEDFKKYIIDMDLYDIAYEEIYLKTFNNYKNTLQTLPYEALKRYLKN